jgi:hypothetical protein
MFHKLKGSQVAPLLAFMKVQVQCLFDKETADGITEEQWRAGMDAVPTELIIEFMEATLAATLEHTYRAGTVRLLRDPRYKAVRDAVARTGPTDKAN